MKKMLYLEGATGISGDMTVAALLDLGGSREKLDAVLQSMHLSGFEYEITRSRSHGVAGCDFNVILHDRDHDHEHDHGSHHEHRNLDDVEAVIDRGVMTERARAIAKKIFSIVAGAEAEAHGCAIEEVHFHEVGAVDSIVDAVAAAVLFDDLGIGECVVDGLTEGTGFVHCQHGELPVPVPAVLNIARRFAIPLRRTAVNGEMVTPTGIAIAAALRTRAALPEKYTVEKCGAGLGKRDFGRPNMLRAMIISESGAPEDIWLIETNIDDATGEALGLAMEKLFQAGALDVHFVPCFMKKNRPAWLLRVIAAAGSLPAVEMAMFEGTTTIGMRKTPVERVRMERETVELSLPFGKVAVKRCSFNGITKCYPEYESVRTVAEQSGVDFQTVFNEAEKCANAATPPAGSKN
ncbi:MAG: nickel pincer cofactor biosynthesis protein LarC [Victivallaceae bacterium]|nr:nickel pincer cofactor biosynthesis protein LarC [Victivallaceae bacterium]